MNKKYFIFIVLVPLFLGIFSEELFGSTGAYHLFFLTTSFLGSIFLIIFNHKTFKIKIWYLIGSFFVLINFILLFLSYNFHPGF